MTVGIPLAPLRSAKGRFLAAFGMTVGIPLPPYAPRRGRFLAAFGMTVGIPLAPLRSAKGGFLAALGMTGERFGMAGVFAREWQGCSRGDEVGRPGR